jgi:hypothetical protein
MITKRRRRRGSDTDQQQELTEFHKIDSMTTRKRSVQNPVPADVDMIIRKDPTERDRVPRNSTDVQKQRKNALVFPSFPLQSQSQLLETPPFLVNSSWMHHHAFAAHSEKSFAIYMIAQRQPAPPSSPELLARMEPLPPVLPAPSASSSSKSAGLTVMWTTLAFWRAKGRSNMMS